MSVKKVQGHIDAIQRKLEKSIKIADKGPNMKLGDVIKLGRKTNSIVSEIKKSISEYDGADPTPEEAQVILTKMEKVVELTEKELATIVQNKPRIDELHVGGLVKRNLLNSQEAGAKFSVTLNEKAPDNLKPSAQALEERRNKAFDKAVSVFANAQGGEDQADGEDDSD
ncbi:hypothetical protein INS49_011063 [Diaporthe citri]|uniref:uncharacterized protein n=1 Tax=Diaporthe citri TaxID=83186 RepID=UPI001C80FAB9|nr:uncharacterized protein INS49_011063 [Diaporthe citri]KAG6360007.1 hypothetical protein INS49_011063 [Diaporthe citri]